MGLLFNLIKSIIYGIVEGITEWLPVSSTAHLIMMRSFMPLNVFDNAAFDQEFWDLYKVVIQLGAILAVLVIYRNRLNPFQKKIAQKKKSSILRMWVLILIACVPTGIAGVLLDDLVDEKLSAVWIMAVMLIVMGGLFIWMEQNRKKPSIRSIGMISQGSWMINSFYKAEHHDDYAWALLPYGDANGNGKEDDGERWSAYNGLGWAAAAKTAHPDECASLIEYFCSEEGQKLQSEYGVTMAGMIGMSDDFANAFPGMDVSPFIKAENFKLYFRPYTRNTVAWEDPIQQAGAFLDAWLNPEDPAVMAQACENAQAIIEAAIAAE